LFSLKDDLHVTYSMMNPFKEGGDDTNQVRSEFCLKMHINQFCEIRHISQNIYWIKLKFYREILETCKYIMVSLQVNQSSVTYYLN
jgi:hypothetical protein